VKVSVAVAPSESRAVTAILNVFAGVDALTFKVAKLDEIVEESMEIPEFGEVKLRVRAPVPFTIFIRSEADLPMVVSTLAEVAPEIVIRGFTTTVKK
jgi:hypothetical protein